MTERSACVSDSAYSRLANDNKLVVHAAGKAQKAADYILNRVEQRSEPQARLAAAA